MFPPIISSLSHAARMLISGGIIIYPTETCYAIGCLANNPNAVKMIYLIKRRDSSKRLPMLAGSLEQANLAVHVSHAPQSLVTKFWPGPLTILLQARNILPEEVIDGERLAAIRVTSSARAARLASLCPFPLISSSANISGHKPASNLENLEPDLLEACANFPSGIIPADNNEMAKGSKPSTIVAINPRSGGLRIVREGVIDRKILEKAHFCCD